MSGLAQLHIDRSEILLSDRLERLERLERMEQVIARDSRVQRSLLICFEALRGD